MDINAIIPWISVAIAIASFFVGRLTAAKGSGEEAGALKMDVKYIKQSVDRIEKSTTQDVNRLEGRQDEVSKQVSDIGQASARAEEVSKSAHRRIDEHLERDHGQTVARG